MCGLWPGLQQQDGGGTVGSVGHRDRQHPRIGKKEAGACAGRGGESGKADWLWRSVGNLENVHEAFTADNVHALEIRVVEHVVGVTDARGTGEESATAGVVNGQQRRFPMSGVAASLDGSFGSKGWVVTGATLVVNAWRDLALEWHPQVADPEKLATALPATTSL